MFAQAGLGVARALMADALELAYFDPDRAVADEEAALAERGVWLRHHASAPATTEVTMTLDTLDALLLDQTLNRVAAERLAAITTGLLDNWLARHAATGARIVVRPVLDTRSSAPDTAVDQHDPPDWMRETVVQQNAHCDFPGCNRDSRSCDLDHVAEYLPQEDGGPPGQTRIDNLAPLCRTHHRVKTHTAWTYKPHDGGGYTWTSPTGHQYFVPSTPRRPGQR